VEPHHVLSPKVEHPRHVLEHNRELSVIVLRVQPGHTRRKRFEERVNATNAARQRLDEDAPAVSYVATPTNVARALEAIQHRRHRTRGEPGVGRQLSSGRDAGEIQKVQALEVSRIQPHAARDRIADEYGLRSELADDFGERVEQD
jgi:hypothetical protein